MDVKVIQTGIFRCCVSVPQVARADALDSDEASA